LPITCDIVRPAHHKVFLRRLRDRFFPIPTTQSAPHGRPTDPFTVTLHAFARNVRVARANRSARRRRHGSAPPPWRRVTYVLHSSWSFVASAPRLLTSLRWQRDSGRTDGRLLYSTITGRGPSRPVRSTVPYFHEPDTHDASARFANPGTRLWRHVAESNPPPAPFVASVHVAQGGLIICTAMCGNLPPRARGAPSASASSTSF